MDIVVWVILGIAVMQLLISVAIAGTLAKLIEYLRGDEVSDEPRITREGTNLSTGPLYRLEGGELIEVTPNYDPSVFQGRSDPYSDGVIERPSANKNWDGVPQSE